MPRLHDKYYTPDWLVCKVLKLIEEKVRPLDSFDLIIEPSAGNGAFLRKLEGKPWLGYDVAPEYPGVIEGDFLSEDTLTTARIPNSICIGNPPFGSRGSLYLKFVKKCYAISNFVCFVGPGGFYQCPFGTRMGHTEILGLVNFEEDRIFTSVNFYGKDFIEYFREYKVFTPKFRVFTIRRSTPSEFLSANLYICVWGSGGKMAKHNDWCNALGLIFRESSNVDEFYRDWKSVEEVVRSQYYKGFNSNFTIEIFKRVLVELLPHWVDSWRCVDYE